MICGHCLDVCGRNTCEVCGKELDNECEICHKELAHGIITPQFIQPQFGGSSSGPKDEDADGGGSNARKALEEGR
jgi:hypothetical protein